MNMYLRQSVCNFYQSKNPKFIVTRESFIVLCINVLVNIVLFSIIFLLDRTLHRPKNLSFIVFYFIFLRWIRVINTPHPYYTSTV